MNGAPLPRATVAAAIAFAGLAAVFAALYWEGAHRTVLAVPAALGWAAALAGLRPLVRPRNHGAFYFAMGIMAFLLFFLHETYEYRGAVRLFPVMVAYAGIVLSAIDIVSLTETRPARAINVFFGAVLSEDQVGGRSVPREAKAVLSMAAGVVLIWLLGFLIAAPSFVFLWMLLWGRKTVRASLYGGVLTLAFIWLLFEQVLSYELYRGIVVEWFVDTLLYS